MSFEFIIQLTSNTLIKFLILKTSNVSIAKYGVKLNLIIELQQEINTIAIQIILTQFILNKNSY